MKLTPPASVLIHMECEPLAEPRRWKYPGDHHLNTYHKQHIQRLDCREWDYCYGTFKELRGLFA
jgi:hypothetical protein